MRRRDREVLDKDKMLAIMKECNSCSIGFNDDKAPYIIPMNFGFEEDGDQLFIYIHGAIKGKKMDLIEKNQNVGFEMDTRHKLIPGDTACSYSYFYQSIVGNGIIEILDNHNEKLRGLNAVMKQYTGEESWDYNEKRFMGTKVMRIRVEEWTCKELQEHNFRG